MDSIITNMGGSHEEDQPTSSLQQVDHHPDLVVGQGGARSYECVFCRRGFTTAQALGGHMNIHRKDRAKSRSSCNNFSHNNNNNDNSNKQYGNPPGLYHPVFAAGCESTCNNNDQEGNLRFAKCFSSMSNDTAQLVDLENNYHHVVNYSPSRLKFGWSHGEDDKESTRRTRGESNEDDDELDLELRLGHDP